MKKYFLKCVLPQKVSISLQVSTELCMNINTQKDRTVYALHHIINTAVVLWPSRILGYNEVVQFTFGL